MAVVDGWNWHDRYTLEMTLDELTAYLQASMERSRHVAYSTYNRGRRGKARRVEDVTPVEEAPLDLDVVDDDADV